MTQEINNNQDVIDSRDIIARIAELEGELQSQHEELLEEDPENTNPDFEQWLRLNEDEDAEELRQLLDLQSQCEGYSDWEYGETLIRDSYFEEYAQELAEDCGMIPDNLEWPCNCIDWERAARELQYDYSMVQFGDVDYWIRS